jgi:Arc/MetJ-type ribon-helix-helix transcriptional regulator
MIQEITIMSRIKKMREENDETEMLHVRITKKDKEALIQKVNAYNFRSISDYIRFLALNIWKIEVKQDNEE